MANHRLVGDRFHDNDPRSDQMIRYREPALTATTLLAPLVGLILLFIADMTPAEQASWNGVAVTVAGLITAVIVARDKLAPAILGLAQAVIGLLTVYGLGMSAEQTTATMGFLALLVGAYVRTQVHAPLTSDGQVVAPAPATYAA
jgi:nicotinamide riboside transporter PnuC